MAILEECEIIIKDHPIVTKEMVFNENVIELKTIAQIIDKRIELLENSGIPCHKESSKKTKKEKS